MARVAADVRRKDASIGAHLLPWHAFDKSSCMQVPRDMADELLWEDWDEDLWDSRPQPMASPPNGLGSGDSQGGAAQFQQSPHAHDQSNLNLDPNNSTSSQVQANGPVQLEEFVDLFTQDELAAICEDNTNHGACRPHGELSTTSSGAMMPDSEGVGDTPGRGMMSEHESGSEDKMADSNDLDAVKATKLSTTNQVDDELCRGDTPGRDVTPDDDDSSLDKAANQLDGSTSGTQQLLPPLELEPQQPESPRKHARVRIKGPREPTVLGGGDGGAGSNLEQGHEDGVFDGESLARCTRSKRNLGHTNYARLHAGNPRASKSRRHN